MESGTDFRVDSGRRVVSSKITFDIPEAQQHCRFKAHLRLRGEVGIKSDFEKLLFDARQELRINGIEKIIQRYPQEDVESGVTLSRATLRKGIPLILLAHFDDDRYAVQYDGLKKVDGASTIGEFHYEPIMFSEARHVRKSERHLLATLAILLSRIQGTVPRNGILFLGRSCAKTTIRFGTTLRTAEDLLGDIERMQQAEKPPQLLLNDHCPICEFRERCRARAVREDNLSLLRGLGEKAIRKYRRKGILTLAQLAHTFRPRRRGKRSSQPPKQRDHALHALALRDRTVYVLGKPDLPTAPVRIYVDVEGVPDEGFAYLVGLVVCDGERVERYSFWADSKANEAAIFNQFLGIVSRYVAPRIYCYGSYEKAFIVRMRQRMRRRKQADAALAALTNVLAIIYPHFYFPTHSNGLKDVSGCLGCHWSEPDASGIQSIVWRAHWEKTHDEFWKTKLIQCNSEDCDALRRVTQFLGEALIGGSTPQLEMIPRVASVTEIDKLARTVAWTKFTDENFDYINKRAYFDYQRTRVFVRTSKVLKRHNKNARGKRTWKNREIRATHHVEITASRCPFCKSKDLITIPVKQRPKGVQTRQKRAFDIVVTPGAVRRKVIDAHVVAYRCLCCDRRFVSDRYHRLAKYYHGFMSWFAYQQITHRLGVRTLTGLFQETFGIRVHGCEFLVFRDLLARYYRKTYKRLLARIIAGPVVHVDETEVKLHSGTGYVWVFANVETAVYVFRPNREGGFLREIFKDFNGVLVSDFYSAYDGLNCLQQALHHPLNSRHEPGDIG
jgi:predicted RecB family nuclease